jgi:hypothetical protein
MIGSLWVGKTQGRHEMKRTSVFLDDEQYEILRLIAFENRKPMGEFIRQAIDDYLKRHQVKKQKQGGKR